MDNYHDKENYVYKFNDSWNRKHNKYKIMSQYKHLLNGTVGELGSNSGYHCFLAAEFDNVKEVIGIDLNEKAIRFGDESTRKIFKTKVSNKVRFICANLSNIPLTDEYFDVIITFHTLEHIYEQDLDDVIKEKVRLLKPDGTLIVSVPYKDAFKSYKHVSFFDEKSLDDLLTKNGLYQEELYVDKRMSEEPNTFCLTGIYKKCQ